MMDYGNDVNPRNDHEVQLDYEKYAHKYKSPNTFQTKDWTYYPSVSELQQELTELSTVTTAHIAKVQGWLDTRAGVANFKVQERQSNVVQKLVRKQNEWKYPALEEPFLSTDRLFLASVNKDQYDPAIEEKEDILNYQFTKEIDRIALINEYVRNIVDIGTVIFKVSWDYEEREEEIIIDGTTEYDEKTDTILETGLGLGTIKVKRVHVVKNQPNVEICDIESVHISSNARGDASKARTIIHQFPMTFSELKADGRYSNLDSLHLTDFTSVDKSSGYALDATIGEIGIQDIPRTEVLVNEYWGSYDIHGTGIVEPVVFSFVGDTMIRMEKNPYPLQEMPFIIVQNLPILRSNYGEADAELLKDNQDIISALVRGAIDVMGKTATGQRITAKNVFDKINQSKFERGEDCEINNMGIAPKDAIFTQNFPELPNSLSYLIDKFNFESESLTGIKAFSNGITGSSLGDTATGIRSAMDATAKRELSILRRLANGLLKLARKIDRLNIEYLTDEDILHITGAKEVFMHRTQYQRVNNFDLRVSTPELQRQKADVLSFMLQTLGQTMDEPIRNLILSKIADLQGEEDLVTPLREHKAEPDPIEVEKHQAELEKIKSEIAQNNSMSVYYQSMARRQESEADLKDLDMVHKVNNAPLDSASKEADIRFKDEQAKSMQVNTEQQQQQPIQEPNISKPK